MNDSITPLELDFEVLGAAGLDVCILFSAQGSARELARRVHHLGQNRRGPFQAVDCGWPDALLEPYLEHALRPGGTGTIFLEEVGRLSPQMQARLLGLLDSTGPVKGTGRTRSRVMASTSERLIQRALEGTFDERLFYRLNTIHVILSPELGHPPEGRR